MKLFFVFIVAFAMTGCASLGAQFKKAAEADEGQDRARLRILATHKSIIKAVPEMECLDWSSPKAGVILGGVFSSRGYNKQAIDIPYIQNRQNMHWAELYVAADKPISIYYSGSSYNRKEYTCDLAITFTPKPYHDYEVRAIIGGIGRVQCFLDVVSLSDPEPVDFSRTFRCR